ncbi:MAG: hypothetical protein AB4206_21250 [Xenococcaceae cyanobacterium]
MNETPARKRRRDTPREQKSLVPLLNGKRARRRSDPLPGTVYVSTREYIALKEEPAPNSQLEHPPRRLRKIREATSLTPSNLSTQGEKATLPHPLKDQRPQIQTFTKEVSAEITERFIQDLIPESITSYLSDEQLSSQKLDLSTNLADLIKTQLDWALNRAWLEAQNK